MDTEKLAWLAIRFTGVILLTLALISTVRTVSSISLEVFGPSPVHRFRSVGLEAQDKEEDRYWKRRLIMSALIGTGSQAIIYGVLGCYFLFGGKSIFKAIVRDSVTGDNKKD